MKTTLALMTVAALFTGASADSAEAAKVKNKVVTKTVHRDPFGHKVVQKQKFVKVRKYGYGHHHHFRRPHGFSASVSYGAPIVQPVVVAPRYHFIHKQIWVPAVTNQIVVGYSQCGSPLYDTVIVTPACYKTARYKVYSTGAQVFVGYVG
ncbi:MAG: hypothetical protein ACF8XB_24255 [Planctomycetota bacterium JB042]